MTMRMTSALALMLFAGSSSVAIADQDLPKHQLPPSQDGNLVLGLCDGTTSVEIPGVKPGQPMTREQAQWAADTLMAEWRSKNPDKDWVVAAAQTEGLTQLAQADQAKTAPDNPVVKTKNPNPGAPAAATPATGQVQTYGAFTERDEKIWQASTDALVAEGNKIFHDASLLGSTDAISCDMCHPNAANTHPETYPKYQVQLGRVALLRDMINWCIENPVRGKPLADDDPKMKALEAYILAQRKGTPLNYGKH
jgi:thiosulfate dehydrogenase